MAKAGLTINLAGGTWIDPEFFSDFGLPDWNGSSDNGLAAIASMIGNGYALQQLGSGWSGWSLYDPLSYLMSPTFALFPSPNPGGAPTSGQIIRAIEMILIDIVIRHLRPALPQ